MLNYTALMNTRSFLDETFSSISSDEHELMTRSYSCELPQTPSSNHPTRSSIASTMSSNSQLSHPSPTPSSASSSSNSLSMNSDSTPGQLLYRPHRPKFGQTSPKQLRKLLALGVYAGHQHSIANNFYVNGVQITSTSHILNNNQPNKTSYSMHMMPTNQHFSNVCCSMGGRSTVSCCTSSGNGLFFPSQPYCSCCNSIMRPSMMIMAPPQTSGLMPNCHCSSRNHTSRRHNSLPPKQSLPVESSSVTSLRRLDQYQQMTRYRDIRNSSSKQSNRRPQCPDYDTTMQRICGGNLITVNGINPASVLSKHRSVSNCGGGNGGDQPQHHHREDIV
ncbi:hypothetical protein QR98_0047590 [Sarcoptes scabiei]|uniref:Uncharacterized protein n=1 Tax=Sarcoptes scabiei TaxID=52283 RepID=A0A132A6N1_SARSC|nr:hypothetical protein QR98_0047590 [Sarcoptes scabiei]